MKIKIEIYGKEEKIVKGIAYLLNTTEKEVIEDLIKNVVKEKETEIKKINKMMNYFIKNKQKNFSGSEVEMILKSMMKEKKEE